MRSKVSSECNAEEVKDCRTKSLKKLRKWNAKRTEEALELVSKENELWTYQNEREEANILQGGARKLRMVEDMALAPPRNVSNWP